MEALMRLGQPVPNLVPARLLIDTGASCTLLDCPIIAALGIDPTGQQQINTPSTGNTPATVNQYDISLFLAHRVAPKFIQTLPIIESDFSAQPIDGLLGRDVLRECLLVFDGEAQRFSLAF